VTAIALVLQFTLCAALIGSAGYLLTLSADRIAKATGLTGGWLGLALLATVTSLPELSSGIAAVTWVDAPNLAVGNVLGACVFNLAFLAVVDAVQRREPLYALAGTGHLLSVTALVMIGLLLRPRTRVLRVASWVSVGLLAVYVLNAALHVLQGA
jgi:cation:H+ antiporter